MTSKLSAQTGSLGAVGTALTSPASHPTGGAIGDFRIGPRPAPASGRLARRRHRGKLAAMKDAAPSAASVADGPAGALAAIGSSLRTSSSTRVGRARTVDALDRLHATSTCAAATSEATAPRLRRPSPRGQGFRGRSARAQAGEPPPAAATPPAAPPATAGLKQIRDLLEAAPSPLDTEGVLDLLHQATAWEDRDRLPCTSCPCSTTSPTRSRRSSTKDKSPTQVRIALRSPSTTRSHSWRPGVTRAPPCERSHSRVWRTSCSPPRSPRSPTA